MTSVFLDSSGLVPMLLHEPHSGHAITAWQSAASRWAWRWAQVETEAALIRRRAAPAVWQHWRELKSEIGWLDLEDANLEGLCAFNRVIGLRAADAGHLYIFDRALAAISSLELLSFDHEMVKAASALNLPVWNRRTGAIRSARGSRSR